MFFKTILAVAVACASVEAAVVDWSHDQPQSALNNDVHETTIYDVRRFAISSKDDAAEVMRQAKSNDLDLWSLTDDHADIYFPTGTNVPPYFQSLPHTSLAPTYDAASVKRPTSYPSTGPWNTTTIKDCHFHNGFHTYTEIDAFIQQLADEFPQFVELVKIGRTSEGRDIIGMSISKDNGKWRKKRMIIHGAQHAREWIATSTATYIAHALLVDHKDPHSKHKLLNRMDFTIVPLPNPDGYAYTWERDRLWYKNRQDVGGGKCKGVDLNRNWDYEWQPSADEDPCSHWFPGDHAFNALETRAMAAYVKRTPNIRAFIDLRSYGQIIMHPFSHSCAAVPKDEENLMEAALGAAKAMGKAHGTIMRTGSLCDKLYSAPGNMVDWMYGHAEVKVTYSVMLRDTGTYGFLLPSAWVRPVGEETADMVDYLVRWIKVRKP